MFYKSNVLSLIVGAQFENIQTCPSTFLEARVSVPPAIKQKHFSSITHQIK